MSPWDYLLPLFLALAGLLCIIAAIVTKQPRKEILGTALAVTLGIAGWLFYRYTVGQLFMP